MVGAPECRHRFASKRTIFSSLSVRRGYGLSQRRKFGHFNFKKFILYLGSAVFNQKREPFMLEYWYKEKRTPVDFRRGPLGAHFDGFGAYCISE